jgi:hypothetical protein
MPNQSPVITDKSLSSEILAQFFSIYIFTLVAHSIEPNSIRGKSRPSAIINIKASKGLSRQSGSAAK